MTVSTFTQTNANNQILHDYFNNIDSDINVFSRISAAFAPHQTSAPSLSIIIDKGSLLVSGVLLEIPSQTTANMSPPVTNNRIDRVVLSQATGTVQIVGGTENATPVAPPLPARTIPIASVLLTPATTTITNSDITDERVASSGTLPSGCLLGVQRFQSSGTYTPTPGTAFVIVEMVGAGGSGGGSEATSSSTGAAGGGGGAGAYGRGLFKSGFSGVTVTVPAATPANSAGAAGINGNPSSFGTLMSASGGLAGTLGPAVSSAMTWGSNVSTPPANANLVSAGGAGGEIGIVINPNTLFGVHGGSGGQSAFGKNSGGSINGAGSGSALPYGAGGGGASGIASSPARAGGTGNAGLVLVYEYS